MSTLPGLPGWFDWITVAAILLGPILALSVQRWLDSLRQEKQRKFQLFETGNPRRSGAARRRAQGRTSVRFSV